MGSTQQRHTRRAGRPRDWLGKPTGRCLFMREQRLTGRARAAATQMSARGEKAEETNKVAPRCRRGYLELGRAEKFVSGPNCVQGPGWHSFFFSFIFSFLLLFLEF
jgi:hypothetical protein